MKNTSAKISHLLFSRWLLAAVLLISVVTFAGSSTRFSAIKAVPQTTAIYTPQRVLSKSLSFERAVKAFPNGNRTNAIATNFKALSIAYSLKISTRISSNTNQYSPQTGIFTRQKTVPQDNGTDLPIALS